MLLSTVHKSNPLASGGAVFAGSLAGTSGNSNATGSNARFSAPSKIIADSTGNFYVSDTSNHLIRKVTQFGVVTTVFGTGSSGSSLTTLNSPRALALDFSNNLYISDFSNNRILSISNGHTLGSNATLIASGLKDIEEIAVNSNGSQMLFKTNSTFGVNLIQYRNGTVDGIVNTSQNDGVPNVASVAYNSDGQFYYSTTTGQSLNYQISAFKMNLNPPTTYVISVTSVTQESAMYPASAQIGIDPVSAGFSVGQSFTLSGFSSELVNGYIGTISALNVGGASNIQFKYTGDLEAFRVGAPNREATLNYDSTEPKGGNSRVLGLAWDTIPTITGDNTDSPGSVLRMNYFLTDSEFDFPDYPYTAGANQSYNGTTIYAKGFLGDFAIYSQPPYTFIESAFIYDFQYNVNGVQIRNVGANSGGSTTSPAFVHEINFGGGYGVAGPEGFSPLNGFILGPNIEPGTTITAYTTGGGANLITTNKAFFAVTAEIINFDLEPIGDRSATNEFSYTLTAGAGSNLLIGMKLTGPGAGASRIIEIIPNFADLTKGIIKTDANVFIPENNTTEHGATGKYVFGPWIGGSKRLLSVTFTPITFPASIGAGTLTATIINNNPTSVMIDGVFYGTFLKNMQFSRLDSSLLYANLQGPYGIRQYANVEGSFVLNDENQEIPNINQFALFPTTTEIIAVVPQPTSNNLEIYQNEY
jgi:hypothetical protein